MTQTIHYREVLQRELEERKKRNNYYSLRAFSRDLGLAAPKLSQILKGKVGLSPERAKKVAKAMDLGPEEATLFVTMVALEHGRSRAEKLKAKEKLQLIKVENSFNKMTLEKFRVISDWYHTAILELMDTKDFKSDIKWISARLAIPMADAREAIERLSCLGLIQIERTRWVKANKNLTTSSPVPSREIRRHHSQVLRRAETALEEVDIRRRDFSTTTFAVSSDQYESAIADIKKFRRQFMEKYQTAENKDEVYSLAIQFFPLTKRSQ